MKFRATIVYRAFAAQTGPVKPMVIEEFEADSINGRDGALGQMWRRFNHAIPGVTGDLAEHFKVRSMSVGDEIHLQVLGQPLVERYVCAPVGFTALGKNEENRYAKLGSMWNPDPARV